ncbi:carbohydrate ABC transporter substrate-binding protein, CUT1 family [Friedmanniella luteola]|uniref:Carbohydrate ABC transporter substrate-binding protein, CUT1 family n=1 Tax=Friedmanniella luteola TaxID=546871 RepID=A0A1H1L159_9ACTN|nr:extracellular solute-binding protein [Friedmanniella luteola]SDR68256.1 carbohydrate ABC transporter substrate-binding protein, CUT1 family [Friedmanniella luteola]
MRRREFLLATAGLGAAAVGGLTACGGNSSGGADPSGAASSTGEISGEVKVTFQQFGNSKIQANFLGKMADEFTAAHPQASVKLQPITASENDYYTKLQLAMRSPRTAPDMCYEDTFLINSDISAGYLTPLDDRLATWSEWSQFKETAKGAARALDGKTYGIPDGTDVRAIWFNKTLFERAGLPTDWAPKTWADLTSAAQTIKDKVPDVIPLNVYAGTGVGEAASMQGFEMLLYGTPNGTLFDADSQKWVVGAQGFKDALTFYQQIYSGGLAPTPQQALAPTWGNTVGQELLPQSKLAIAVDGSWLSGNWLESGAAPWPAWEKTMGNAAMPTQNGEGNGQVTLSGGWTWAIPQNAQNPEAAWAFMTLVCAKEGELEYAIKNVQIPVRTDVAEDPSYVKANPTNAFFSKLVENTIYRPAYSEYAKISLLLQQATEKVVTGTSDPVAAAKFYDDGVTQIVGQDKVITI